MARTPRWEQEKHIREHTAQAEQKPGYYRPLHEVSPKDVSPEWAAQQRRLAQKPETPKITRRRGYHP